jgi:hypothetical protein
MKSQFLKITVASLLILSVLAGDCWAKKKGKANKPPKAPNTTLKIAELKNYKGKVEVTKDRAGNITEVKLKVGKILKKKYNVALDGRGKELGERMAGQQVQVRGMVQKKAGAKWLLVKDYRSVVKEKGKAPKPAKKTKKADIYR